MFKLHTLVGTTTIGLAALVGGCDLVKTEGTSSNYRGATFLNPPSRSVAPSSNADGAIVVTVTPEAGATISTANAEGSEDFKAVSVVVPPGVLAFATAVSVQEVTSIVNMATSETLGLATARPAGPSVAIEASDITALAGTIQINLPISTTNLNLAEPGHYVVIGLYKTASGELVAETFVGQEITFEGRFVKVSTSKFGAYQVAFVQEKVEKKSQVTTAGYIAKKKANEMGASDYTTFFITTQMQLPDCNSARISHLYYVRDSGSFFTCDGSQWSTLSIKGEKGEKGEKGDPGAKGDPGVAADLGNPLYLSGQSSGEPWGYLRGHGSRLWASFKEGFHTPLQPLQNPANGYAPVRQALYFGSRDCTGMSYLADHDGYDRTRLSYTQASNDPYVLVSAERTRLTPLSVVKASGGCENLLAMQMLGDINPAFAGGSNPTHMFGFGDYLYFNTQLNGYYELWRVHRDGANSERVKAFPSTNYPIQRFVALDNTTFAFAVEDSSMQKRLWRSDGTSTGTQIADNALQNISDSIAATSSGKVVFGAGDGSQSELHIYDPSSNSTSMVDINPGVDSSGPESFTAHGNWVYFTANNGTNGVELWRTDGTQGNTQLVADVHDGVDGSYPTSLYSALGKLFFAANDNGSQNRLFVADEFNNVTMIPGPSSPDLFTLVNGKVYFKTSDNSIWVTDGTEMGTTPVATASNYVSKLAGAGTKLYYIVDIGSTDKNLMVLDTTVADAPQTIKAGLQTMNVSMTAFEGKLYFEAHDDVHGKELWVTDGTAAGTKMVLDINPKGDSQPQQLGVYAGALYMSATVPEFGRELFRLHLGTPWSAIGPAPEAYYRAEPFAGYRPVTNGAVLETR